VSQKNIFAFTELVGNPGYISINRDAIGRTTMTVRGRGNNGSTGQVVTIDLPHDQIDRLLAALIDDGGQ
jgi:hypothetical protein